MTWEDIITKIIIPILALAIGLFGGWKIHKSKIVKKNKSIIKNVQNNGEINQNVRQ